MLGLRAADEGDDEDVEDEDAVARREDVDGSATTATVVPSLHTAMRPTLERPMTSRPTTARPTSVRPVVERSRPPGDGVSPRSTSPRAAGRHGGGDEVDEDEDEPWL